MYETVCGDTSETIICAGADQPLEKVDLVAPPNPAKRPSSFCVPEPEPEPPAPVKPPDSSASAPTLEEIDRIVADVRAKASTRPNAARWAHFTTRIVALDLPARDRLQLVELIKIMEQEDAQAEALGKLHRRLSSLQIAMTATIPILIPLGMHQANLTIGDTIHYTATFLSFMSMCFEVSMRIGKFAERAYHMSKATAQVERELQHFLALSGTYEEFSAKPGPYESALPSFSSRHTELVYSRDNNTIDLHKPQGL